MRRLQCVWQGWMIFLSAMLLLVGISGAYLYHYQSLASGLPRQSGCVDIPAVPDYLATGSTYDAIAAINNAHVREGLPPLKLPLNFYQLGPVQQQFILVNLERKVRGLSPLRMDANLAQLALNYSKQLRDLHFFSHTSPIGGTFNERIDANPAIANHYRLVAENLAGNPVPGAGAIYEYMYDDAAEGCSHRANILDPTLSLVGIGEVAGSPYGSVSVQEFLAPAPWSPYTGAMPHTQPPHISLRVSRSAAHSWQLQCRALASVGVARITWFIDHVGSGKGQLLAVGSSQSLDLRSLAPGSHTLLVYAVDGEQNYGMATYTIS
jgi:Cysteine-rich secretory protein family